MRNESFICEVCHAEVQPLATGCRNHCPHCLHSMHLDNLPGDRSAECGGIMSPTTIYIHSKKGYMVEHRCKRCGHTAVNKLTLEDPQQPDDREVVVQLLQRGSHT